VRSEAVLASRACDRSSILAPSPGLLDYNPAGAGINITTATGKIGLQSFPPYI
jgi:hypothetical protein